MTSALVMRLFFDNILTPSSIMGSVIHSPFIFLFENYFIIEADSISIALFSRYSIASADEPNSSNP